MRAKDSQRTDYECMLRLSVHRISELARQQLGLVHLSPQIDRDVLLSLQRLQVDDVLTHALSKASKRIVWVVFTPRSATTLAQFNEATVRLKQALGASWWE